MSKNQKKDCWDKIEIFIRLLGVVVVGGFGLYFTDDYRMKQAEVSKLEVMEKLYPFTGSLTIV